MSCFGSFCTLRAALEIALQRGDDNQKAGGSVNTSLDRIAIVYLAAPVALMAATWLPFWIGIPAACVMLWAAYPPSLGKLALPPASAIALFGPAFLSVAASGLSPFVETIPFLDIAKHRWIFNDLVTSEWPVIYDGESGKEFLRYYLGLYLVPAAVSKIWGHPSQLLLMLWTSLGVWIFLAMATERLSPLYKIIGAAVLLLFGGLDVIAVAIQDDTLAGPATGFLDFREHWAREPMGWLIGGQTFSISWSTQHAIPAWISASLLMRNHDQAWFLSRTIAIFTVLCLWSPFVALTFSAVVAFISLSRGPSGILSLASPQNGAALIPLSGILVYLASGSGDTVARLTLGTVPLYEFVGRYAIFVLLEFGILAVLFLFAKQERSPAAIAAILTLIVLPFFHVGLLSDLGMRGSMLPMTVLLIAVVELLNDKPKARWAVPIAAVLVVGFYTGVGEGLRLLYSPRTSGDWQQSIQAMPDEYRNQYIAPVPENSIF